MGNLFAPEKPLKDVIRENQRSIKKSVREMEKEIVNLEKNEKKLIADIKSNAKKNQMGPVRIMAKDLARTRQYITKFIEMKTHLNAVALKIQTIKSHQQLSESMKDVTKVLMKLNKQMDSKELEKIMQEFMRENEKAEMTQEMMGEAIDDAMDGESNAAEEDMIVNKVLDELGLDTTGQIQATPTSSNAAKASAATEAVDPDIANMEARLRELNNKP